MKIEHYEASKYFAIPKTEALLLGWITEKHRKYVCGLAGSRIRFIISRSGVHRK
jgi:hypothetical protein